MKRLLLLLFLTVLYNGSAQNIRWKKLAISMPNEWYSSSEATKIAENVLLYQRPSGGWPKNIEMQLPITVDISKLEATIDNDATSTEMKFISRMYSATKDKRYKESFDKGVDYIISSQYKNGGFPQFYPLKKGYYTHITYNDNAMTNVMWLLKGISEGKYNCSGKTKAKAKKSFDKGVECILKTQIIVNGKPTVWCAQHDETTLLPAKARSYELPSFSGSESVGIILLLMDIERPSAEIINAIECAVKWFDEHRILGIDIESGDDGRREVHKEGASDVWARFYDLETEKPFFCDRDGVKRESLNDIGAERRNGYSWYTQAPNELFARYSKWKKGAQ